GGRGLDPGRRGGEPWGAAALLRAPTGEERAVGCFCESVAGHGVRPAGRTNTPFVAVGGLSAWVRCMGGHPQIKTPNTDRLAGAACARCAGVKEAGDAPAGREEVRCGEGRTARYGGPATSSAPA